MLSIRVPILLDLSSMETIRHLRNALGLLLLACLLTFGQDAAENARTILKKVQPQYPALAQKMNIKGSVKLEVSVEPNGSVKSVSTKGGHPLLIQAAQNAIREWRWQPASRATLEIIEVRFNPQ